MKHKSVTIITSAVCVLCLACIIGLWLRNRNPTVAELLMPLTREQRRCVEQVTAGGKLIYVEKQAERASTAVGYLIDEDYYVTIFSVDQNGHCSIEFREKVWDCYKEKVDSFCDDPGYKIIPESIQYVELTDDQFPEVYVWIDTLGPGKTNGAFHVFYVKQTDGSFERTFRLTLCAGMSSVEIDSDSQKIVATDDLLCSNLPSSRKEVIECSLLDGTPQCIQVRHDEW